jgi:hypothetical protein
VLVISAGKCGSHLCNIGSALFNADTSLYIVYIYISRIVHSYSLFVADARR